MTGIAIVFYSILYQVSQAFRHFPASKLEKYFLDRNLRGSIFEFLDNTETQTLFFADYMGILSTAQAPLEADCMNFYITKVVKGVVSSSEYSSDLIYGDVLPDPLSHLHIASKGLYHHVCSS